MARWLWEGSEEDIWTRVTETAGADISGIGVQLQFRPDHVTPLVDDLDWVNPTTLERSSTLVRASKLIVGAKVNGKETKYRVWVKVDDGTEEYVLLAGFFTVR